MSGVAPLRQRDVSRPKTNPPMNAAIAAVGTGVSCAFALNSGAFALTWSSGDEPWLPPAAAPVADEDDDDDENASFFSATVCLIPSTLASVFSVTVCFMS